MKSRGPLAVLAAAGLFLFSDTRIGFGPEEGTVLVKRLSDLGNSQFAGHLPNAWPTA